MKETTPSEDTEINVELVLDMARILGERAWNISGLQSMLGEAAMNVKDYYWASEAAYNWLEDPQTRDERVRLLFDGDPTIILLPRQYIPPSDNPSTLLRHLLLRRQTWLDSYLDGNVARGRFERFNNGLLVRDSSAFASWLPRQQRAYRRHLLQFASDQSRPIDRRAEAVRLLARIPAVGVDGLRPFLELPSADDINVVEEAIAGLAWTDRPAEALPTLMEFLDGDRARVAAYVLPRCANLMAPQEMLIILRELLSRERLKVTVRKEVIRLLGGIGGAESTAVLIGTWTGGMDRQ